MVDYNKPWGWSDQEEKKKQNNSIRPITASEEQAPGPLTLPHQPTVGEQMTKQVGTAVAKEGVDSMFKETGKQAATSAMTQEGAQLGLEASGNIVGVGAEGATAATAAETAANVSGVASAAPVAGPLAGAAVNAAQGKYGTAVGTAAGGVIGGMVGGPIGAMIGSKLGGMAGGAVAGDNKGAAVVTPSPSSSAGDAAASATEDLMKDKSLDVWSEFSGFASGTEEVDDPNIRRNKLLNVGWADGQMDKLIPGWKDKYSPEGMTEAVLGDWAYDYAPSTLTNYYFGFEDGTTGVPGGGKGAAGTNPGQPTGGQFRAHAPGVTDVNASKMAVQQQQQLQAMPETSYFPGQASGGKAATNGGITAQTRGLPEYATNYYNPGNNAYSPVAGTASEPVAPTPISPAPTAPPLRGMYGKPVPVAVWNKVN